MDVDIDTVLAPVDGTDESERAVEYALAIADRYGAVVHILHVIDETVARAVEQGKIDPVSVADEHRAFMESVRADAPIDRIDITQSVVIGFSSSTLRQNPVSAVLDAAEDIDADFVVVPRESAREQPGAMLGKVAEHVLSYASQPVLSV